MCESFIIFNYPALPTPDVAHINKLLQLTFSSKTFLLLFAIFITPIVATRPFTRDFVVVRAVVKFHIK